MAGTSATIKPPCDFLTLKFSHPKLRVRFKAKRSAAMKFIAFLTTLLTASAAAIQANNSKQRAAADGEEKCDKLVSFHIHTIAELLATT
jgi:hypothetical protein